MTLKTLKDLYPHKLENHDVVIISELKTEAIKNVKHLERFPTVTDKAIKNWIIHFFNITKEDQQ